MAENSKRKRSKPWKTIVVLLRKYIFGEIQSKDHSKVREPQGIYSRQQISSENVPCTSSRSVATVNVNRSTSTDSECLSQSFLPYDGNEIPQVGNDSAPNHSSMSPNAEVSSEIAYATELSRLEMITVVTNCAFVFPDFNVESKQIKVCLYGN
jgi:hypothetical protein